MDSIDFQEETALKVKQLKVKCENLEADIKMTDCCFNELGADQEEDRHRIEKLRKRVTQLEADLESVSELFEGKIATLKLQNFELRDHLNVTIDMVNNISSILNKTFNETVDEVVDNTQADDEPAATQPTVQQVYDMYQTQPPDEEGWQEMTDAIKAAEEYETTLQRPSPRVNGLTQDEWKDLLCI